MDGEVAMNPILTVREVMQYLHLSKPTLYRLLDRHEIPAYKVGRQWRFKVEQIDQWRREKERQGNA